MEPFGRNRDEECQLLKRPPLNFCESLFWWTGALIAATSQIGCPEDFGSIGNQLG